MKPHHAIPAAMGWELFLHLGNIFWQIASLPLARRPLSRLRPSRSHRLFRLAAAAVERGLFGRIGDRDHHARLQSSATHSFRGFVFHDSISFKATVKGISPLSTS
jgi:hypothetical protein